jgi:hypothetical protein
MFFRIKSAGSYQYLQIVPGVRQGEKVRQQVFGTERQSYWPPPGCVSTMRNTFGARRISSVASVHEASSIKDGVKVVIGLVTLRNIHAGKSFDDYTENVELVKREFSISVPLEVDRGGIVGIVDVIDRVKSRKSNWFKGAFGWVLANPRHLKFRPCNGALGVFRPYCLPRRMLLRV